MSQHQPLQLCPQLTQPIINRLQRSPRHLLLPLPLPNILHNIKIRLQQPSQQFLPQRRLVRIGRFLRIRPFGQRQLDDKLAAAGPSFVDGPQLGEDVDYLGSLRTRPRCNGREQPPERDQPLMKGSEFGRQLREGPDELGEEAVADFPFREEELGESFFLSRVVVVRGVGVAAFYDDLLELG